MKTHTFKSQRYNLDMTKYGVAQMWSFTLAR